MKKNQNYSELNNKELVSYSGGGEEGRMIGLGLAMALLAVPFGVYGMGYALYNYYKD